MKLKWFRKRNLKSPFIHRSSSLSLSFCVVVCDHVSSVTVKLCFFMSVLVNVAAPCKFQGGGDGALVGVGHVRLGGGKLIVLYGIDGRGERLYDRGLQILLQCR